MNYFFREAGSSHLKLIDVVLPIGISFYTFESLTYVVDVYRRQHKPLNSFWNYQLYILLFPKLIAGPIIRYHEIADQITDRSAQDNLENKLQGFLRFVLGLAKKVFIANTMAQYADEIFYLGPSELSSFAAWVGMFSYTFQIYFDFSGYSDMAIGLGLMFGFRFPENFNNPYTSESITEFWRRWHITLGKWMKNYLYIPLGGNQTGRFRTYFNLWIVFLVSGLWHGASWTFVVWGIYHGTFLLLERMFLLSWYKRVGKIIRVLLTFVIVSIGWVIFRADTLSGAWLMFAKLFSLDALPVFTGLSFYYAFYFCVAVFFSFFVLLPGGRKIQNNIFDPPVSSKSRRIVWTLLSCVLFSLAVANLSSTEFNPFIYFRF